MKKVIKVFVSGHQGMVGSSILRNLKTKSGKFIFITRTRRELDLTNQNSVFKFFHRTKPDQVYLAAARVGGIYANTNFPAEFIYENLMIQSNIIHASYLSGVKKLLFLGSSCIYPKLSEHPIKEDQILNGKLELTNEPYAIAKIAGLKMCESYNRQYGKSHNLDFRSVMPTNIYGKGDNYHSQNSHVIPALIKRFHDAKIQNLPKVIVWGTGRPKREFLYVDDVAEAAIFVMNLKKKTYKQITKPTLSHINVGAGFDLTIKELASIIKEIVKYKGKILFDKSKPDGTYNKLLNSKIINNLGWRPKINLIKGLQSTYNEFLRIK